MRYLYYPGCSLEGTALEYNGSTRHVMKALGAELVELEDWTCCGASAAEPTSFLLSMVLGARNLALGEKMGIQGDILIPCSACYLNLKRVEENVKQDRGILARVNMALEKEDLEYDGAGKARHLLDILTTDFNPARIRARVKHGLSGLRVAPYYGCQCLRPYHIFDDPEDPKSMEPIILALGADIHSWSMGAKCCGAALMTTKNDVGLELTGTILEAAQGADCIVTVCPMCQMNLETYQDRISKIRGKRLHISVLYLPQLLGLAFGLSGKDLMLNHNLALTGDFRHKILHLTQRSEL
ncbi:MAG: CoB--CoM heterodisulfide reductase iron-sulfur subunit B family protein [Deltaproteobacteria bacterium]|nr:CoB--CoM heterodisulfide reductase iron-sulfur subunit B family protein [Deltaproteobacteria bacterium]MBW2137979.1 CoB--CoM heterodisulfide reductase iron-sulfur subunit B family protein [Deltaproteobacteria bacterium]